MENEGVRVVDQALRGWWDVLDVLERTRSMDEALARARGCAHEDAQWLVAGTLRGESGTWQRR